MLVFGLTISFLTGLPNVKNIFLNGVLVHITKHYLNLNTQANLAQQVEQYIRNVRVVSSILIVGSKVFEKREVLEFEMSKAFMQVY